MSSRPTEAEATAAWWRNLPPLPEQPAATVPKRGPFRCTVDGELLRGDECRGHPEAVAVRWTAGMVRAWRYITDATTGHLADPDRSDFDPSLWVGAEAGELSLALLYRAAWGELPEMRTPAVAATSRGLFH